MARDIDGNRDVTERGMRPEFGLLAGLFQNPLTDRHDQAGLLGDRNEVGGRDEAAIGMVPAKQRLGADQGPGFSVGFRLVMEFELIGVQRLANLVLHIKAVQRLRAHGLGEELEIIAAGKLGAVHRRVGIHQQLFCGRAVLRVHRDADARCHDELVSFTGEWGCQDRDNTVGDCGDGLFRFDTVKLDDELIAAETRQLHFLVKRSYARDRIRRPRTTLEPACHFLQ